jgi:transcriptional regulator with XRE-family HTH domain
MPLSDDEFRRRLRAVLERSGLSMRGLSAAMGRDPGYVAALLDATRPSRARPTPDDLLAASDATGIALVELIEALWDIPRSRLAEELRRTGAPGPAPDAGGSLSEEDGATLRAFAAFLATRHPGRAEGPRRG